MSKSAHSTQPQLLRGIAAVQSGYFSLAQANAAGYSSQLVRHHCLAGNFERVRRGIYHLRDYPPGPRDDLVILWLWSDQHGVFSHSTALSLHGLSDLLPERVHMTLPVSEYRRKRSLPAGLVLHEGEVTDHERTWYGSVPLTSPARTMLDCVAYGLSPSLLRQALEQAVARGLLDVTDIAAILDGISRLERG
jgi:predicted transcriptional regulator of viral defense system